MLPSTTNHDKTALPIITKHLHPIVSMVYNEIKHIDKKPVKSAGGTGDD